MNLRSSFCLLDLVLILLFISSCSEEIKKPTSMASSVSFHHLEGRLIAPPVLDGDHLYAATGSGTLVKLDLNTGQHLWTFGEKEDKKTEEDKEEASPKKLGYVNNAPILFKDTVIVLGAENNLIAVNQESGELKWVKTAKEWSSGEGATYPSLVIGCFGGDVGNGILIAGDTGGRVFGVEMETGNLKWTRNLHCKLVAPPVFADGKAYLATITGRMYALEVKTGLIAWKLSKILLKEVKGKIEKKMDDEGYVTETNYLLTVKYKFNFDPMDYFTHGEGEVSELKLSLLDRDKKPVMIKDGEKTKEASAIEIPDPREHLDASSQTEKVDLLLAAIPPDTTAWPITLVLKDASGLELHKLSARVTFEE